MNQKSYLVLSSAALFLLYKCCQSRGLQKSIIRVKKYFKNVLIKDASKLSQEDVTNLNEVIFFPELSLVGRRPASFAWSGLSRLLKQIKGARERLDLCLYLVTLPELANIVISLQQTGVTVRLITEAGNVGISGSQVAKMKRCGVEVLERRQTGLMHNKFAIIDSRILITGSFNWTTQAVINNDENVILTSNEILVKKFLEQFEKLWRDNEDPRI